MDYKQVLEQKIERLKIRIMHESNRYKRSDLEDELFDLESDLEHLLDDDKQEEGAE